VKGAHFLPRFAALALPLLGACNDDPYSGFASDPCSAGNARTGDTACVLPRTDAIAIDGKTDDWAPFTEIPLNARCTTAECPPLPAKIQIALVHSDKGDALAFRVSLADGTAPDTNDKAHRYAIELSALPSHDLPIVDVVVANGDGLGYERSHYVVALSAPGAPDVQGAWAADGIEASVPFTLIAFDGGLRIRARVERADGDEWTAMSDVDAPVLACWNADDKRGDPCR